MHSTENLFQRGIFGQLNVTHSKAKINRIVAWISPYSSGHDYLYANLSAYNSYLHFNSSQGILYIKVKNDSWSANHRASWTDIIYQISYKLSVTEDRPNVCSDYADGSYTRTFHLKVVDIYGRSSATATRSMTVQSPVMMYTDEIKVSVADYLQQASIKISSYKGFYPPNKSKTNYTFYTDDTILTGLNKYFTEL